MGSGRNYIHSFLLKAKTRKRRPTDRSARLRRSGGTEHHKTYVNLLYIYINRDTVLLLASLFTGSTLFGSLLDNCLFHLLRSPVCCAERKSLLGGETGGRAACLSVPSKKLIKSAVHIPNTSAYRPRNVFKNEILSWLEQKAHSIKVSQWSQASFKTILELLGAVCRTYVM